MKNKLISISMAILGMALMATSALSQEIQVPLVGACINSSYVQFSADVMIGETPSNVTMPPIFCPYGCIENASQYGADCTDKPVVGMMLEMFLVIFFISIIYLIIGIWQKKWLFCMFSTILFLVLSYQGFRIEVISGGLNMVYQDIIIVLLCWFSAVVSFIFTLVGMLSAMKDSITKKEMEIKQSEFRGG